MAFLADDGLVVRVDLTLQILRLVDLTFSDKIQGRVYNKSEAQQHSQQRQYPANSNNKVHIVTLLVVEHIKHIRHENRAANKLPSQ